MEADGDNPTSLARKSNGRIKQPQLFKFLEGTSKEPRVSTMQPLADHYKVPVQAFFDPLIADEVAAERFGLPKRRSTLARASASPIISDRQRRVLADLADLLPEDAERFEAEIHALADKMRRHRAFVLKQAGVSSVHATTPTAVDPASEASQGKAEHQA